MQAVYAVSHNDHRYTTWCETDWCTKNSEMKHYQAKENTRCRPDPFPSLLGWGLETRLQIIS